jgi:cytidine deaminase
VLDPQEQRVLDAAVAQAGVLGTDNPAHTVAAAAMDTAGRIFTGVNAHHFTGGPCAELVVLGMAAAAQAGPLAIMAAVSREARVLPPCGRCRQTILDQHPDCFVVLPTSAGLQALPVRDLLPYAYDASRTAAERIVRFSPQYYDRVASGAKRATTRYRDPCAVGPAWLLFEFPDGYQRLPGFVESVQGKRVCELSDDDARLEDVSSAAELRDGLRSHYPGVADEDMVELVRFSLRD